MSIPHSLTVGSSASSSTSLNVLGKVNIGDGTNANKIVLDGVAGSLSASSATVNGVDVTAVISQLQSAVSNLQSTVDALNTVAPTCNNVFCTSASYLGTAINQSMNGADPYLSTVCGGGAHICNADEVFHYGLTGNCTL
jgi:hypothetical protein